MAVNMSKKKKKKKPTGRFCFVFFRVYQQRDFGLEIIFLSLSLSGSYSTAIIMLGW
jgi:hypothetical protein